jgi:DNA polymerase-3 subunit delta'
MSHAPEPARLLQQSLASGRVHSAYLLSGSGDAPRAAALAFARALVCEAGASGACERCRGCRRSSAGEPIALDGEGRTGPLYRHVGDHPDLYWVERGSGDTRVRIGQVRALQSALRLRSHEGGRRAAVIADAEWLNQEAQNALLRLLEEPPDRTTLLLVCANPSGLLATLRSRCQRVRFPVQASRAADEPTDEDEARWLTRLAGLPESRLAVVLDWAEEFRGPQKQAAAAVQALLAAGGRRLRRRVAERAARGERDLARELDAWSALAHCRRALSQRNANPQMVAERALFALRGALG